MHPSGTCRVGGRAMTVIPGTGLLSQDSERGQAELMRSRERTRGWRPSRLVAGNEQHAQLGARAGVMV